MAVRYLGEDPLMKGPSFNLVPLNRDEADAFVRQHHRHHGRSAGHRFALGAAVGSEIVAVCLVGRPVARGNQDGFTVEVTRLASDGTKNACSFLYGAARRAAFALGFRRIITYTLPEEGGASLRGSGFRLVGERGGGSWSARHRTSGCPLRHHGPGADGLGRSRKRRLPLELGHLVEVPRGV
ncbi:MAG: XF1762 family protein [Gemmatimonadaceae bacterium]